MPKNKLCPFCGEKMEAIRGGKWLQHPGGNCILACMEFAARPWNRQTVAKKLNRAIKELRLLRNKFYGLISNEGLKIIDRILNAEDE